VTPTRTRNDVFLSYKSEDHAAVAHLDRSLEDRGARVWRDQKAIRPGDLWPQAIEEGLATSRCVAFVVTDASLKSRWVAEEFRRAEALSAAGAVRRLVVNLRAESVPAPFSDLHAIEVRKHRSMDVVADRVLWPGLTKSRVTGMVIGRWEADRWDALIDAAAGLELNMRAGDDPHRAGHRIRMAQQAGERVVVLVDPFDGLRGSHRDWRVPIPSDVADWVFAERERTRCTGNPTVFVLCVRDREWEELDHRLPPETVKRFRHFFRLDPDAMAGADAGVELRRVWHQAERDLLEAWRDAPSQPS
jgi:hypothetical protein